MPRIVDNQFDSHRVHEERMEIFRELKKSMEPGYTNRAFAAAAAPLCSLSFSAMYSYQRHCLGKGEKIELGLKIRSAPYRYADTECVVSREKSLPGIVSFDLYRKYLIALYRLKQLSDEMHTVKNFAAYALMSETEAEKFLQSYPDFMELLTTQFARKKFPGQKRDDSIERWERANAKPKTKKRVLEFA